MLGEWPNRDGDGPVILVSHGGSTSSLRCLTEGDWEISLRLVRIWCVFYPLVTIQKTMERDPPCEKKWKIHYFDWVIFNVANC